MPALSGTWMFITVIVFIITHVGMYINMKTKGEGAVGLTGMGVYLVGTGALILCTFMVARLDSPTTGTMIGRWWNPFNLTVAIAWLVFAWPVRARLTHKPKKGGKLDSKPTRTHSRRGQRKRPHR